jgi:hypothetical protein
MRRREGAAIAAAALVGVVVVVRVLADGGVRSGALRIVMLAVIVAAILYTRLGPREH